MDTLLIIFAREPRPGQVKTRLTPPLPPEAASRLYRCFLEDILEEMARVPEVTLAVAYTPPAAQSFFRALAPEAILFPQEGPVLGERLTHAFAWGWGAGFRTVMIRNSDSPDLPGQIVREARAGLTSGGADLVLGPSLDGGYYLVGLNSPHPELFHGISWSTAAVLQETLARARASDLMVHLLPSWPDIDTFADLKAFLQPPIPFPDPGWRAFRFAQDMVDCKQNPRTQNPEPKTL